MVRRELTARLSLGVAPPAGAEDDGRGVDHVIPAGCPPAVLARLEAAQRRVLEGRAGAALPGIAQPLGDRVPGPVADLEQPLLGGAAAAGKPVAPILPSELDAELLQPVDRARGFAGQDLDELAVGGLVRGAPDVLGVLLR